MTNANAKTELAFGGGCFWCLEAAFTQLRGVKRVVSGYAGGAEARRTRKCAPVRPDMPRSSRSRSIRRRSRIGDLLDVFFTIHDPTTLNRQGGDVGTQYRSVIFHHDLGGRSARPSEAIAELTAVRRVEGQDRHRARAGADILRRRGLPPALFRAERAPAVLPGGGRAQGGEAAQDAFRAPESLIAVRLRDHRAGKRSHGRRATERSHSRRRYARPPSP